MIVVASTDGRLVVQTPNRVWWPGIWLLGGLLVLALCFLALQQASPQRSDSIGALEFFGTIVLALTAFLSTHQWLSIEGAGVEYQRRLGPLTLTRKRALLSEIGPTSVAELQPEADGAAYFALLLPTKLWKVRFGWESNPDPIEHLLARIVELQTGVSPSRRQDR